MNTLLSHIKIDGLNTIVKNILLAFVGSIVIALSAQITVPMVPVSITMQTFAVLSVGMALGSRYGALSLIIYLSEGALGLPVFANGGFGLTRLLGPSGGYLFGFVLAAYIVGYMAERGWDRTFVKAFIAMLIGNVALYIPGLIQLGASLGWDKPILAWGLTPFIVGDLAKAGLASLLFPAIWNKINK